ncbi:GTP cyclohydrolase I FolE [Alkanindiges sp. WGS2144]|uniref:GTP cyclohydrolase I FolE n=1 Tax=Alkanindiges sp. WGS2144 TaxID=3366808 RepID=UPI00375257F4
MTMQQSYANLISAIGEDLERPGLIDTPARAAKAFSFLTHGYNLSLDEVTNNAVFPSTNREMVLVKGVEFYSLCEHHMLPFMGQAHIAYLPNDHVLGLSKFARIVDMYARRLQIQEGLTQQIAQAVMDATGARGAAVVMDAAHMCMMMRGVQKQQSTTRTVSMLGEFATNAQARQEFLMAVPEQKV